MKQIGELHKPAVMSIIRMALAEDIGSGDVTTLSTVDGTVSAHGTFLSKDTGVVAGLDVVKWVFEELSPSLHFQSNRVDGDLIHPGDVIAVVIGPAIEILMGERVALNLMQRMSATATLTSQYVKQVSHTKAKIVDTRKTTPGLRILEKYAVRAGGGGNHRFGLYDAVLIKDNHIVASGSITQAVKRARAHIPHTTKIEVECETPGQVEEALRVAADIIMLDNMDNATMADMVRLIDGAALVEASGNISLEKVAGVAETGVDLISIGRLTRAAGSLDISLDLELVM